MACRDSLQELFGVDDDTCQVRFDGQPPAMCGELFIAVHGNGWRRGPDGGDVGTDEVFGVKVTVTRRISFSPDDRNATAVWLPDETKADGTRMEFMLRRIMLNLTATTNSDLNNQTRYLVLLAASRYIEMVNGESPGTGFALDEPLRLQDGGDPVKKGYAWFSASPPGNEEDVQPYCGVAHTISFTGARRLQNLAEAT